MTKKAKIAFAFSKKKEDLLRLPETIKELKGFDEITWHRYDHRLPQKDQGGPFDLILHKVCDVPTKHQVSHSEVQLMLEEAVLYNTVILDSIDTLMYCEDRVKCMELIRSLKFNIDGIILDTPHFALCSKNFPSCSLHDLLSQNNITFPLVVKSNFIYDCRDKMHLILDQGDQSIVKLQQQIPKDYATLIQNFINHDGVIFKLAIIGNRWHVSKRSSIRNVSDLTYIDSSTSFESRDISKNGSVSNLINRQYSSSNIELDSRMVAELVTRLKKILNCTLLGVDIIRESSTNNHYVIDINYFTGFRDVPNRNAYLKECLEDALNRT